MSALITVQIRLFARYAELLGRDHLVVAVPSGATVGEAVGAVRALPGGEAIPAQVFVARQCEHVRLDAPVRSGDELALLPPMSGG
jgi:molybdopterin converting factor small subunit